MSTVTHDYWCGKFYDIPPGESHDSSDCLKSKAERRKGKIAEVLEVLDSVKDTPPDFEITL